MFKPLPRVVTKTNFGKRKRDPTYVPERKKYIVNVGGEAKSLEGYGSCIDTGRRKSSRLKGLEAPDIKDIEDDVQKALDEDTDLKERRKSFANRPMVYGRIPEVDVGTWWQTRMECNQAGIHRPTVAGIHSGPEGAYSIALSGGYEDDIDLGDCFTYTGEGGRDLKGTANKPKNLRTAPQSKDQCLSRGNAGLIKSVENKMPVRVIRGYKSKSAFAPEDGYRYDGLYRVEKYWYTTGLSGFSVYKFALQRMSDQAPPPWDIMDAQNNNTEKPVGGDVDVKDDSEGTGSDGDSQDSGIGSQPNNRHGDDSDTSDEDLDEKSDGVESDQKGDVESEKRNDVKSEETVEVQFEEKDDLKVEESGDVKSEEKDDLKAGDDVKSEENDDLKADENDDAKTEEKDVDELDKKD